MLKKFFILLMIAGVCLFFYPAIHITLFPFVAFKKPIHFQKNEVLQAPIRAAHSTDYDIEISVSKTDPSDIPECLLTGQVLNGKCSVPSEPIELNWEIKQDGKVLDSAHVLGFQGANSWSRNEITRSLGSVHLESSQSYEFKVEVLSDYPSLNQFKPQIVVSTNSLFYKDYFVRYSILQMMGLFLFITGALSFAWNWWQAKKSRKPVPVS